MIFFHHRIAFFSKTEYNNKGMLGLNKGGGVWRR